MGMWYTYVLPVQAAILDLPLTPMLKSIHISSAVLAELENVGVAIRNFVVSLYKS